MQKKKIYKVNSTCPTCLSKKPKPLIYQESKVNCLMFIVLLVLTLGIGLFFKKLWKKYYGSAYCEDCGTLFGKFLMK